MTLLFQINQQKQNLTWSFINRKILIISMLYLIILLILWDTISCKNPYLMFAVIKCYLSNPEIRLIICLFTGNGLSIAVLYRQDMDLKPVFKQILITLISFDTFCIVFNLLLFCFSHLSIYYYDNIFPYIVPYILPLAQIALTGKSINFIHFQICVNLSQIHSIYELRCILNVK